MPPRTDRYLADDQPSRTRRGRHPRRRGAAHRAGPRHSRPVVERVPVAAAQRPDRARARRQSRHPGRRGGAAGRPVQRRAPSAPRCFPTVQAGFGASQNQTSGMPVGADRRQRQLRSTACSRSASPSATRSTCSAPTAGPIESLEALAEAQCFQLEARLSVARLQRRRGGHPGGLAARPDRGDPAHHRRPARDARHPAAPGRAWAPSPAPTSPRQEAALAQAEATLPPLAEGAGAAAQPARHPDRPPAERPRWPSASSSPTSRCRTTCRSACRRGWSSSGPTCARPRPTCTRPAPRSASPSPTSSRRSR